MPLRSLHARLVALLVLLLAALAVSPAHAGRMDRQALSKLFPPPLLVGDKESKVPAWPIYHDAGAAAVADPAPEAIHWPATKPAPGKAVLLGYVFESIDLAPLPGFAGKPIELLVAIDADGKFVDVRVLDHKEPMFKHGLPAHALENFALQFQTHSIKDNIQIIPNTGVKPTVGPDTKLLNGVTGGTISVRVLQKTALSAAVKVARTVLGLEVGIDAESRARLRINDYQPDDWKGLQRAGLVQRFAFKRGEIEKAFAGSPAAAAPNGFNPNETAIELFVAPTLLKQVSRNLLDQHAYQQVHHLYDQQTFLFAARGAERFVSETDLRGGIPERLMLRQGALPIELRDFAYYGDVKLPEEFNAADVRIIRIAGDNDANPGQPLNLTLRLSRAGGAGAPVTRDFNFNYVYPESVLIRPPVPEPAWKLAWRDRALDLAILAVGLLVLAVALTRHRALAANPKALSGFRVGYLLFTLGFIGWYAQGQLSIVNLTALLEALRNNASLEFFLLDPMSLLLWGFVFVSLFAWGRGTFCGWLCPFGALQELLSRIAQRFGVEPRRLPPWLDARLKLLKYVVLAALIATVYVAGDWTDAAVEVEPFKTAISLYFVRSWPYVAWAAATVLISVFVYRGFCRYLCPLGAAIAVLGVTRRFNWIARRAECGTPCQTCRYRCHYQAIAPSGQVQYSECFQCLDCVAIHESDKLCAPRVLARRKPERMIPIRPLAPVRSA